MLVVASDGNETPKGLLACTLHAYMQLSSNSSMRLLSYSVYIVLGPPLSRYIAALDVHLSLSCCRLISYLRHFWTKLFLILFFAAFILPFCNTCSFLDIYTALAFNFRCPYFSSLLRSYHPVLTHCLYFHCTPICAYLFFLLLTGQDSVELSKIHFFHPPSEDRLRGLRQDCW